MTDQRIKHALALMGSLATAVLPAWIDPAQTWAARVALTIVTGLLLAVKTDKLGTYRNAILGGLALAGVVVAGVVGKFTAGSAGFAIGGFVLAVLAQLKIVFAQQVPAPVIPVVQQPEPPIDRKPAA